MEVKWDANRDPNQKLAVTVDFTSPASYDYAGNFVVSYPGRTINGVFDFAIKGNVPSPLNQWLPPDYSNYSNLPPILTSDNHLTTMHRLSWRTEESIVIKIRADYRNDVKTAFALQSELITPFDDWKKTSLNGG